MSKHYKRTKNQGRREREVGFAYLQLQCPRKKPGRERSVIGIPSLMMLMPYVSIIKGRAKVRGW